MNNEFFIGDLHLGHKKILDFSPQRGGTNVDEHNEWIIVTGKQIGRAHV